MSNVSEATLTHFTNLASSWDAQPFPSYVAQLVSAALRQQPWYLALTKDHKPCRAMELGSGTGLLSFLLVDDLTECVGVDPTEAMVKVYNEKVQASKLGDKLKCVCGLIPLSTSVGEHQASLAKLGTFDFVFSQLAFHHIKDCNAMVDTLASYLKPGGRLLIVDFEATPNARLFHPSTMALGVDYEHDGLGVEDVRNWFVSKGQFRDVQIQRLPIKKPSGPPNPSSSEPPKVDDFVLLLCSAERC